MPDSPWGKPVGVMRPRPWRVRGGRLLGGDRPLLMGILNVTPDSFFDGGKYARLDAALARGEALLAEGADLLDVGGESTRPGAVAVPEDEERARVIPVIEGLVRRFGCIVSVDTMKASVAREALDAGAAVINDVSALTADPRMAELARASDAGIVLNHMRDNPGAMQRDPVYCDAVGEIRDFLAARVRMLTAAGVPADRLAVDPGIGFGKRLEDNYALIEHLEDLDALGCPVLLGHSRKSFIGKTPGLEGSDRLHPSVAVAVYAALKGASILRVHDVGPVAEALRVLAAVRSA